MVDLEWWSGWGNAKPFGDARACMDKTASPITAIRYGFLFIGELGIE